MLEFLMEPLNRVVKNLVVLVILATFLEMLLPENNMRKYARLIFGLMILATILHPVASLLNQMDRLPQGGYQYSFVDIDEQVDSQTVERVIKQYEENIANQTKAIIQPYTEGYKPVVVVKVVDEYSDENFGEILSIHIVLYQEDNHQPVEPVQPVVIGESSQKKADKASFEEKEKVTEAISSYYHISESLITVKESTN
ncbi:stage III sporulation protein AF [Proteinivorax hydrogeniformans]|uniref:Stage III sporulation protein AF n=1 Tax=Proteinivorax hydrogeniformans TaxID=1826727 RepID=A0AAU8HRM7_9FIRM